MGAWHRIRYYLNQRQLFCCDRPECDVVDASRAHSRALSSPNLCLCASSLTCCLYAIRWSHSDQSTRPDRKHPVSRSILVYAQAQRFGLQEFVHLASTVVIGACVEVISMPPFALPAPRKTLPDTANSRFCSGFGLRRSFDTGSCAHLADGSREP